VTVHGANDRLFLRIVTDGTSGLHYGARECGFGDDAPRPDRVLEFILVDGPAAIPGQVEEEIEHFRLHRDVLPRHAQFPPVCIEDAVTELVNL
jgi:hypothetical protein